jgi:hypothetical protein
MKNQRGNIFAQIGLIFFRPYNVRTQPFYFKSKSFVIEILIFHVFLDARNPFGLNPYSLLHHKLFDMCSI